jgi:hypothetical protein
MFEMGRGLCKGDPLSPFFCLIAAEGLNLMLKTSIVTGLFKGYQVGSEATSVVHLSHLQFAGDTLIVGEKSWVNICVLRANLMLFELISDLNVNFNKSLLVGVNISYSWLVDAAQVLNCKLGRIPFLSLGLSVGGDARHLSFWISLVEKIRCKLSPWKNRHLSMGVRLVLIKYVVFNPGLLSFLLQGSDMYHFLIKSIFKAFLWGGSEESRKIMGTKFVLERRKEV